MEYEVIVPPAIEIEIASWQLPDELLSEMYRRLGEDLAYGHEDTCFRLPAPSPTYVYQFQLRDPILSQVIYTFTFHLTYGPQEYALYVLHSRVDQDEQWGQEDEEDVPPL